MNRVKRAAAMGLLAAATAAYAGDDWRKVADLTLGHDAQAVEVNGQFSAFRLKCVEGVMSVNTVMALNQGAKRSYTLASRINPGETKEIQMGAKQPVSGFRIGATGRGRYELWAYGEMTAAAASGGAESGRGDWKKVATVQPGKQAQMVGVSGNYSGCMIKCTDGMVSVNTLMVLHGGTHTEYPLTSRFTAGQSREVMFGGTLQVTGLRLSDGGRGTYEIWMK